MVSPGGSVAAGGPGAPAVLGLLVTTPQPEPSRVAPVGVSTHPALLCWREAPSVWEDGTGILPLSLCKLGGETSREDSVQRTAD